MVLIRSGAPPLSCTVSLAAQVDGPDARACGHVGAHQERSAGTIRHHGVCAGRLTARSQIQGYASQRHHRTCVCSASQAGLHDTHHEIAWWPAGTHPRARRLPSYGASMSAGCCVWAPECWISGPQRRQTDCWRAYCDCCPMDMTPYYVMPRPTTPGASGRAVRPTAGRPWDRSAPDPSGHTRVCGRAEWVGTLP